MRGKETKHFKALYFDLCVKELEKFYSAQNPRGAYKKIQKYLLKRHFLMNSIRDIIRNIKQQIWKFLILYMKWEKNFHGLDGV